MSGDGFPFFNQHTHDATGHGGLESNGAIGSGVTATGTQGAGILDAVGNALMADVERGIGWVRIENDAMGPSGDEEGQDAGADEMGVGFDLRAVQENAPLTGRIGWVDLNLVGLAIDFKVEGHDREAFPSIPPMASRRDAAFQALVGAGAAPLAPFFVASKTAAATTA